MSTQNLLVSCSQDKNEPLWQEEFNHRAAILEYDGGFSRAEAEEEAGYWLDLQKRDWERRHAKVSVVDMSDG